MFGCVWQRFRQELKRQGSDSMICRKPHVRTGVQSGHALTDEPMAVSCKTYSYVHRNMGEATASTNSVADLV